MDDYDDREIIPSEYWKDGKVLDDEDVSYYWHLDGEDAYVMEMLEHKNKGERKNMSNVNVINNLGKDVTVAIDGSPDNIKITIDLAKKGVLLSSLKSGQVFSGKSGTEYILLELEDGRAGVIRRDLLPEEMKFGKDNNFDGSGVDKYLNNTYIKELEEDFGIENILESEFDLLSMDGFDDYRKVKRKVGLLDFNRYRKYHKTALKENMPSWWWLIDPDSTPSGYGSHYVQCVDSDGSVNCGVCRYVRGVRPFFFLKSSIFVSLEATNG